MLNILSKNQVKQSYLPSISNSLSEISKADSLIKKVVKVVKFIILMPALVVYDSLYLLSRPFKKSVKKVSLMDRVFPVGFEKNKALVAKLSITAVGIIGSYPFIKNWLSKPSDQGNPYLYSVLGIIFFVGISISGGLIWHTCKKKAALKKLEATEDYQQVIAAIEIARSAYRIESESEKLKKLESAKSAVETALSIKHKYYNDYHVREHLKSTFAALRVWSGTIDRTIDRLSRRDR